MIVLSSQTLDMDDKEKLLNIIEKIGDDKLKASCKEILKNEEFFTWPASIGKHHGYKHGLITHTLEVLEYALGNVVMLNFNKKVNFDVLIATAVWHDYGKIWDYKITDSWRTKLEFDSPKTGKFWQVPKGGYILETIYEFWIKSDYHKLVHHVTGSIAEFTHAAKIHNVDIDTIQKIQHCIMSHHGFNKDWSLKQPQSLEALILHQADILSAMYGKTK